MGQAHQLRARPTHAADGPLACSPQICWGARAAFRGVARPVSHPRRLGAARRRRRGRGGGYGPIAYLRRPDGDVGDRRVSQMSRCPQNNSWINNPCNFVPLKQIAYMGYTVRVAGWRYTVWLAFNGTTNRAQWGGPMYGEELYDHAGDDGADFDAFENANAVNASANQQTRYTLLAALRARFDTRDRYPLFQ